MKPWAERATPVVDRLKEALTTCESRVYARGDIEQVIVSLSLADAERLVGILASERPNA